MSQKESQRSIQLAPESKHMQCDQINSKKKSEYMKTKIGSLINNG